MDEPEIICETRDAAGIVTLNRPKALNALTHGMVIALRAALDGWADDPSVTRVVLRGAGERAFCAGGDIRMLYEAGRAGDWHRSLAFWRDEYLLNIVIKRYRKPYISLIDGIVMGGGVGISLHGSHRVAGDRYRFAMPEVGIGFFPDVGATWALPRLPGKAGAYLALTGAIVGADDGAAFGLATHRVPSASLPGIERDLVSGAPVDELLAQASMTPPATPLSAARGKIDACFAADSVKAVLQDLDRAAAGGDVFAREAAATIRTKSPSSLAIAFEQLRRGGDLSFDEAMTTEFRIVSRIAEGHDFYEGVRATIIDKDNRPRWNPATLDGLDPGFVARHFAPLGAGELPSSP